MYSICRTRVMIVFRTPRVLNVCKIAQNRHLQRRVHADDQMAVKGDQSEVYSHDVSKRFP